MVRSIFLYGNKCLRSENKNIDIEEDVNLHNLILDMFDTLGKSYGIGLAAPQIGEQSRIFVVDGRPLFIDDESLSDFVKTFINPKITERYGDEILYEESCLSLPGIRENILRRSIIRINYLDENLKYHDEVFTGLKARIIQHEYDHIEGILFIDHLHLLRRKMIKGKLNDIIKGKINVAYKTKSSKQ